MPVPDKISTLLEADLAEIMQDDILQTTDKNYRTRGVICFLVAVRTSRYDLSCPNTKIERARAKTEDYSNAIFLSA